MTFIVEIGPPCVPFGYCSYSTPRGRFRRVWFLWFGFAVSTGTDLAGMLDDARSGKTEWRQ